MCDFSHLGAQCSVSVVGLHGTRSPGVNDQNAQWTRASVSAPPNGAARGSFGLRGVKLPHRKEKKPSKMPLSF